MSCKFTWGSAMFTQEADAGSRGEHSPEPSLGFPQTGQDPPRENGLGLTSLNDVGGL